MSSIVIKVGEFSYETTSNIFTNYPRSKLASLTPDSDGVYHVEEDTYARVFPYILEYLSTEKIELDDVSLKTIKEIAEGANHYQIHGLVDHCIKKLNSIKSDLEFRNTYKLLLPVIGVSLTFLGFYTDFMLGITHTGRHPAVDFDFNFVKVKNCCQALKSRYYSLRYK
uniref:Potassium channel tetramerisation-type BTB domain-containing protein n=1 Tax=viral metagenome TaxID=1070528 RepID=A0A6C0E7K8_9ZZZZ